MPAVLPGEPDVAVAVFGRRVEIGVAAGLFGELVDGDLLGFRIVADDRVLTTIGDPGLAVLALDHAVRGGVRAELDGFRGAGLGIENPERTILLGCPPDEAVRSG